jgi:hypothetical protein
MLPHIAALTWLLMAISLAAASDVTVVVNDPDGAAGRVAAPVSVAIDLEERFGGRVDPRRLQLAEQDGGGGADATPLPVQFEPRAPGSLRGDLWWLAPPGGKGRRRFRLTLAAKPAAVAITAQLGGAGKRVDVIEGGSPVARYSHGTVPVPAGVSREYVRGDYINLLYGPDGELLTDDYPKDHPHHRGVSWSWPVTRWKDEVRDIWAVRGVWARPVAIRRVESGPVTAVIEAESVWKWGDRDPIVREKVVIRAFRQENRCRFVDVEVRLTASAGGVAIGGRPQAGYGGFGLRAAPVKQQRITAHVDPPSAEPRRAWLDYSGVFAGSRGVVGLTILEHVANPGYPNELKQYPQLNYVMPAFPGPREVALSKEKPLVLKHRLWIHCGAADEKQLADAWAAHAWPPQVLLP